MKKTILTMAALLGGCAPATISGIDEIAVEQVPGEWFSGDFDSANFVLGPHSSFPGVVRLHCSDKERKVVLTVLPDGQENVRVISLPEQLEWSVHIYVDDEEYSTKLTGGNGKLPTALVDPSVQWIEKIGNEEDSFVLAVNHIYAYLLPASELIKTTAVACLR